jgi:hypothetical protein
LEIFFYELGSRIFGREIFRFIKTLPVRPNN